MSLGDVFDLLQLLVELLKGFFRFWLFLFSRRFRADLIRVWKARSRWTQILIPLEVAFAIIYGTLPFWLTYIVVMP